MIEEQLCSDADLARRVESRKLLKGVRRRLRCKRCRQAIPETRRLDALFCSAACCNVFAWEQRTALRTEMRAAARLFTAPRHCACGAALNNKPGRPGVVSLACRPCRDRDAQRASRERKQASA